MKLNLIKRYDDTDLVLKADDTLLVIDYLGITFIDEKSGEKKGKIQDFFGAVAGMVTKDNRYLLLGNMKSIYRSYDLQKKEMISELDLSREGKKMPFGHEISLDGKSLYLIMAENAAQMLSGMDEKGKTEILKFSFPDFEKREILSFPSSYYDLVTDRESNGYLMVNMEGHLDFMKSDETIVAHPEIAIEDASPVLNERRKEVYVPTEFGFRVYDENWKENNKFDLISDEKKNVDLPMYYLMKKGFRGMNQPQENQMENAEEIHELRLLDENHVVALITEVTGAYFRISVFDVRDGSLSCEIKCGFKIMGLDVLDEKHIGFFARGSYHLLEIQE